MAKKAQTTQPQKPVSNKDLYAMSKEDLSKKASELRAEIVNLKRGTIAGEVQNFKATGAKRRELARVLTVLNVKNQEDK